VGDANLITDEVRSFTEAPTTPMLTSLTQFLKHRVDTMFTRIDGVRTALHSHQLDQEMDVLFRLNINSALDETARALRDLNTVAAATLNTPDPVGQLVEAVAKKRGLPGTSAAKP
jgi:hypothetical protein